MESNWTRPLCSNIGKVHNLQNLYKIQVSGTMFNVHLKGHYTPNLKLARFVCYLKIINTFLKNNVRTLKQMSRELKNDIGIFSRPSG